MPYKILKEFFYTLTGALVIFVLLEFAWSGIVLAYINMNWVLIIWLIVGIVILVLNRKKKINGQG